jgi:deoxyribose-phosphate aldolase
MMSTPTNLAQYIDHTLLKPEATSAQVKQLCEEARTYSFFSVCVNSAWVPLCRETLGESDVKITAVVGFPLGANGSEVKAFEAAWAVEQGANEIDMVLSVGQLLEGNLEAVEQDIARVVKSVEGKAIVKVIMETGLLNDQQKITACELSEKAGAHFVKTATGFGPGGATADDIRLMRKHVSEKVSVKASGGIRDTETALAMIEAGAARLGLSAGVAIMKGLKSGSDY